MAATARVKLCPVVTQRSFGNTGLQVGVLGFGAAAVGFEHVSDRTVDELLGVAADGGVNVIDTAAMYGDSEERLGRALQVRSRRNQFLIFTKCGRSLPSRLDPLGFSVRVQGKLRRTFGLPDPCESPAWHPRVLKANLEQSLRRLKSDHVDVIQLHTCSEATLRRGDVIDVLERARESGKARYIGYSGDNGAAIFAIRCGRFDCVQVSVNVADQNALDDVLPLAAERGVGLIAKRPIADSLWMKLTRADLRKYPYYDAYQDRLQKLHYEFLPGERAHELALRFTLGAQIHTAIVGTRNPSHLLRNIQYAAAGALPFNQFEEIRARWKEVAAANWVGQT